MKIVLLAMLIALPALATPPANCPPGGQPGVDCPPWPVEPELTATDHHELHIGLSAALGFVTTALVESVQTPMDKLDGKPRKPHALTARDLGLSLGIALLPGIGKEVVDHFTEHEAYWSNARDIFVYDLSGALVGVGLAWLCNHVRVAAWNADPKRQEDHDFAFSIVPTSHGLMVRF